MNSETKAIDDTLKQLTDTYEYLRNLCDSGDTSDYARYKAVLNDIGRLTIKRNEAVELALKLAKKTY